MKYSQREFMPCDNCKEDYNKTRTAGQMIKLCDSCFHNHKALSMSPVIQRNASPPTHIKYPNYTVGFSVTPITALVLSTFEVDKDTWYYGGTANQGVQVTKTTYEKLSHLLNPVVVF